MKYDLVSRVEIGYNLANHVNITNVVSFSDRVISPDGSMLYPFSLINTFKPTGVHHSHKYWEMEMVLDTNWLESDALPLRYWAYWVDVQVLAGLQEAIVENGCNNYIEWFKVFIREHDGTTTTLTYADGTPESNKLWCVSEVTEVSNEKGERHQTTTFRFICFGERERTS